MASSSSSSPPRPRTWRYRVFTSFHGPDVRKTFLTHLRKQFNNNGISMFDDQEIERSQTIELELIRAIRDSRISIVVLSKNYASSSWCLDELVEIFECKKHNNQIVMTVFYDGVNPSDVRKQTGDFGKVFKKTCARKTEEERRQWKQALTDAANIAGEHFLNWDKESEMIEKIARDVSNKLNITTSRDLEDMVGIEAHLKIMQYLLNLDYEYGAGIVGISGPAGIGKTTIARALQSRFSSSFDLTCFMENVRGGYNNNLDDNGSKMCLQEKLLSKILNQDSMNINGLDAMKERLSDQKVLIILDDVDDLQQLEALANNTNWFGPGSRIIVTTEDRELLEQHNISNRYNVDFPTKVEARKIFCRYAFRRSSAPDGYENLTERATELCGNLPFGLRVMGSILRGKKEDDWESILRRLENSYIPKIDAVLRVGYDSLHEDEQTLFLLIAVFFNYDVDNYVKTMLADSNLDVRLGLKTLADKSLIQLSTQGEIVMHKLLQQVGRQAIQRQEPWKRQILVDTDEIRSVLENDSGRTSLMGISLDISKIVNSVDISARALKSMSNLRFLRIHRTRFDTKVVKVHVPEDMDFPASLRSLHWDLYPRTLLPRTFCPEHLVDLDSGWNQLEKLWEGTQPLANLKKMNLLASMNLKEVPDLSKATNLEKLVLRGCSSLVELPSSIENLHKLELLEMDYCTHLQFVPTHFNLASLERVEMVGCWQLRKIPDISTNITKITIADTMLEELPRLWSRLETLIIHGSDNNRSQFKVEMYIKRSGVDIEKIPDWIKDLHGLKWLHIIGCPKLASMPELPGSLRGLIVDTCESLETLSFSLDSPILFLDFPNCFRLGQEARRVITHQSFKASLPGEIYLRSMFTEL